MIKVYKIVNNSNRVEYVGMTSNMESRFFDHTRIKPNNKNTNGKFYNRKDVKIELISEWSTRAEASKVERYWQVYYNVVDNFLPTRQHFNENDILEIRSSTKSVRSLARDFNCARNTINKIQQQQIYKNIV